MKNFIIFFVNKSGLNDFVYIKALDLKDATVVSKSFAKSTQCEVLGVCRDCFKSFKLDV